VNARGLIAAAIAVWSTALQQYVCLTILVYWFLVYSPLRLLPVTTLLLFSISCKEQSIKICTIVSVMLVRCKVYGWLAATESFVGVAAALGCSSFG
jgi:hypothetical protein